MIVLIKTLQVVLALSILIIVHEFGHYIFAKIFGIRVDKFYLFFDAGGFRLFSTRHNKLLGRLFPRLKDAETDYGIGWLPLGGYCKISGMVDESMDTEQLRQEPKSYEFRTHPAWQRLLVMSGGVLFNFLLAIGIYIFMLYHNGQTYIANEENCIWASPLAEQMGFRTGDRILSYDDYQPENFGMLQADLARRGPRTATVLRDGDTVRLWIDHARIGEVLNCPEMFGLAVPFVVDTLVPGSPNAGAGLMHGDVIESIDGIPTPYVQSSRQVLEKNAGMSVEAVIARDSTSSAKVLQVDSLGRLGIYPVINGIRTKHYTLAQAVPAGISLTFERIGSYIQDMRLVFTPSTGAYKSVGSFIAIGQAFPSMWDWNIFFNMVALLSIMLGVMNLLPIPGLDGGHIVITLFEIFTRRKPSEKFLMTLQMIGMVLIFMLMFLAFGNDITRLLK